MRFKFLVAILVGCMLLGAVAQADETVLLPDTWPVGAYVILRTPDGVVFPSGNIVGTMEDGVLTPLDDGSVRAVVSGSVFVDEFLRSRIQTPGVPGPDPDPDPQPDPDPDEDDDPSLLARLTRLSQTEYANIPDSEDKEFVGSLVALAYSSVADALRDGDMNIPGAQAELAKLYEAVRKQAGWDNWIDTVPALINESAIVGAADLAARLDAVAAGLPAAADAENIDVDGLLSDRPILRGIIEALMELLTDGGGKSDVVTMIIRLLINLAL